MAIGWMTALKLLPWGELVAAAPEVVQAARRLLQRSRRVQPAQEGLEALPGKVTLDDVATVVHDLEQRIEQLEQGQRESAALLEAMAEQNARMVAMLDAVQQRSTQLLWAVAASAVVAVIAALIALSSR